MRFIKLAVAVAGCLGFLACSDGTPVSPLAPQLKAPLFTVFVKGDPQFTFKGAPTVDNGTCGAWADDTNDLIFTVHDNGDGTFRVRTEYKGGQFVTRAGASPGACQFETPHGTSVLGGIKGNFTAWVEETITSATYTPGNCPNDVKGAPPGPCSTRTQFILQVFGCIEDACVDGGTFYWNFDYRSKDKRLVFNHWLDTWPALYPNEYSGDIATE